MAISRNVACKVLVKADTGSSNALESLGYSIGGVNIEERPFNEPIHSDENGGPQGPPVDIIHHGEMHVITFDMVSYDAAVAAKLKAFRGTTDGSAAATPCGLLFADSGTHRILLLGSSFTRNYLRCVVSASNLGQVGSHASVFRVTIEAYMNASNVLWNTTTS